MYRDLCEEILVLVFDGLFTENVSENGRFNTAGCKGFSWTLPPGQALSEKPKLRSVSVSGGHDLVEKVLRFCWPRNRIADALILNTNSWAASQSSSIEEAELNIKEESNDVAFYTILVIQLL